MTEIVDSDIDAVRVARRTRLIIIVQFEIIDKAIDHVWRQGFQIKPQFKILFCFELAKIVWRACLCNECYNKSILRDL